MKSDRLAVCEIDLQLGGQQRAWAEWCGGVNRKWEGHWTLAKHWLDVEGRAVCMELWPLEEEVYRENSHMGINIFK